MIYEFLVEYITKKKYGEHVIIWEKIPVFLLTSIHFIQLLLWSKFSS